MLCCDMCISGFHSKMMWLVPVKLISKHTGNTNLTEAIYTRYFTDIKDNYRTSGKHGPKPVSYSMHTTQCKHSLHNTLWHISSKKSGQEKQACRQRQDDCTYDTLEPENQFLAVLRKKSNQLRISTRLCMSDQELSLILRNLGLGSQERLVTPLLLPFLFSTLLLSLLSTNNWNPPQAVSHCPCSSWHLMVWGSDGSPVGAKSPENSSHSAPKIARLITR